MVYKPNKTHMDLLMPLSKTFNIPPCKLIDFLLENVTEEVMESLLNKSKVVDSYNK